MVDIPGFPGYKITEEGDVWSFKGKKPLKIKLLVNKRGYLFCNLSVNGKHTKSKVHQLMAITFLGHKPCGHQFVVDHINNNSTDNRLKNLQIITNRQNTSKDKKRDLPIGVCKYPKYNNYKAAIQVNGKNKHLGYFATQEEASRAYQDALAMIK